MPPRRSNPRSTQRVKLEISPQPEDGSASPDPIALTPAPTTRLRRTRASESSPAPSTQAPSSELRTGSGARKSRLRSGRRSKGHAVEEVLGEGDLVVPSDEEEYEAWVDEKSRGYGDGKRGESSKMAQERYAKLEHKRTFVSLFTPSKNRVVSPPLETEEWNSSGYTTTTVALSAAGSSDDPFTVGSIPIPNAGVGTASNPKIVGSEHGDEQPANRSTRPINGSEHIDEGPGLEIGNAGPSQVSVPRSTLEKIPRGPAMEDLEDLDVESIKVPMAEEPDEARELVPGGLSVEDRLSPSVRDGPEGESDGGYVKDENFSLPPQAEGRTPDPPHTMTCPSPSNNESEQAGGQEEGSPSRSQSGMVKNEQFTLPPIPDVRIALPIPNDDQPPESPVGHPKHLASAPMPDVRSPSASPGRGDVPGSPVGKLEQFSLPPLADARSPSPPQPDDSNTPATPMGKQERESLNPILQPDVLPTPTRTSQADHHHSPNHAHPNERRDIQKEEPESIRPIAQSPTTPHRRRTNAPIPSQTSTEPMFTPPTRLTQFTQDSPLVESQMGPHNTHLFSRDTSPSRSPSRQEDVVMGTSLPPSSPPQPLPDDMGDVEMKDDEVPNQDARGTQPPRSGQTNPPASSPDAIDLLARRSPSLTPLPDTPPAQSVPAVDPALERFRGARSFRTRTTLQLQPYTRERLLYEAALRKGGLKTGKRAIGAPREISQPDNGDDLGSRVEPPSTDHTDPEAIVIEPSPPPSPPPTILDVDRDEYFFLHDKIIGREITEEENKELERIAKARLAAEKAERRKERETKKMQKLLERFRREQERGDPDDETYRPMPVSTALKRKSTQAVKERRTPVGPKPTAGPKAGRIVTYTRHRSPSRPAAEPTSESEASARVRLSNMTRPSPSVQPMSPDLGGYGGFDNDFDDQPPPLPPNSPPRTISSGSSDSDSSSSDDHARKDKRARIAGRMLPAAMLRQLEKEEARKLREKQAAKKRQDRHRSPSPIRPGRAVVRQGNGESVDFSGFLDEVAAGPSSSVSPDPTPEQGFESDASTRERPIMVGSSDDSDSQAEEDHGIGGGGGESLAQLYRGDFESLVAGKGRLPAKSKRNALDRLRHTNGTSKKQKQSRPALGLRKHVKAPDSRGRRMMVQSRLDFPDDRTPTAKRKRPTSTRKDRPAIRLDDHTIFATDDFAFEEDENDIVALDDHTPRPSKRVFGRTKSITVPKEVETLDMGVGKARSWAHLDKYSVDFGISPLPSGLYCSAESVPGSGRLAELVDIVNGKTDIPVVPCVAYGVELYPSLTVPAIQAVVSITFDKIYEATTARILSKDTDEVDLSPLAFLGAYMVTVTGETEELMEDVQKGTKGITAKLDLLDLPTGRSGQDAREVVIKLRWALFELSVCLARKSTGSLATDTAVSLISLLLSSGFDKAIRPLKSILRGESDTAEISDLALTTWIATLQLLSHFPRDDTDGDTGLECLVKALDTSYPHDQVGPIASERIWYLVFGLCAVHQFDIQGCTSANYTAVPQWTLVRRAISLIKISHNEEAEEGAHLHQLQGRDRYIRIMLARCIRLSSVWQWPFDRASFSIVTKDLGVIFRDRQYRNLPTELPVDFPAFITQFDMTLTAALDTKRESAFELYLRLVCVAASDLISASQSLSEAKQAEKDIQRLVSIIMPQTQVKFNRILPPTPRQLGQIINRYSIMVAATYFNPSLLEWFLSFTKIWVEFENADFDSRQVSIRGLMYVAVACRHHGQSLDLVVGRLAEILGILQKELDRDVKGVNKVHAPTRLEVERTMVMVVSCVKQVILHHTFDPDQTTITYPDPSLLHESWTTCVFALDLSKDLKCSTEVVATIQAFLDIRLKALPASAKRAREEKVESQDEFGSLGFDLDDTTLAQLGGETTVDPVQKQDAIFATVLEEVICPRIYRLLSDMLPAVSDSVIMSEEKATFVAKLTRCFSDCAAVLVIDHRRTDWLTFIGLHGKMSWMRLGDERGRWQVGLHFMLNVARIDPSAFSRHEEDFIILMILSLVTATIGIEQEYFEAVMSVPKAAENPLLAAIDPSYYSNVERFMEHRIAILEVILMNISDQLKSRMDWAKSRKPFFYKCLNLLVNALASNEKGIHEARVLHKQEYRAFIVGIVGAMTRIFGPDIVEPIVTPSLKDVL